MSKTSSESSVSSINPVVLDENESIEALSRAMRVSRRKLEKELSDAINDCNSHSGVWLSHTLMTVLKHCII